MLHEIILNSSMMILQNV